MAAFFCVVGFAAFVVTGMLIERPAVWLLGDGWGPIAALLVSLLAGLGAGVAVAQWNGRP